MIGVVVALKSEAMPLINKIENAKEIKLCGKPCFVGKLADREVALIISGIGKVSASLSTQALIDKLGATTIINYGTCGGTNSSINVCDYYMVDKAFQFDFDVREIDDVPLGYIQEYDRVFFNANIINIGLKKQSLATSDRFSKSEIDLNNILNNACFLRDMEGCAIIQVAVSNDTPVYIVKGVTDVYGSGTDGEQFYKNLSKVCENFPNIILKLIQNI
jgi:adenosylhomocysteine nucleosidase